MTYWALNAIFLGAVALIGLAALTVARRQGGPRWSAVLLAGLVLLVLTAGFDNVMIAIGLVGYREEKISGIFIGVAPLEDFAYPLAAALLLPSIWVLTGGRSREPR